MACEREIAAVIWASRVHFSSAELLHDESTTLPREEMTHFRATGDDAHPRR
jgi:hypothetical protein